MCLCMHVTCLHGVWIYSYQYTILTHTIVRAPLNRIMHIYTQAYTLFMPHTNLFIEYIVNMLLYNKFKAGRHHWSQHTSLSPFMCVCCMCILYVPSLQTNFCLFYFFLFVRLLLFCVLFVSLFTFDRLCRAVSLLYAYIHCKITYKWISSHQTNIFWCKIS